MGNNSSKPTNHNKCVNSSPRIVELLINGYARIQLKNTVIPNEIIILCYKFHGNYIASLTLPLISNTQYAKCVSKTSQLCGISFYGNRNLLSCLKEGSVTGWSILQSESKKFKTIRHCNKKFSFPVPQQDVIQHSSSTKHGLIAFCNVIYDIRDSWALGWNLPNLEVCTIDEIEADSINMLLFMDKAGDYLMILTKHICFIYDIKNIRSTKNVTLHKKWHCNDEILCGHYYMYSQHKILITFCTKDSYVYIIDFISRKYLAKIYESQVLGINCVDISCDGSLLVTAGEDSIVRIYDISKINWNKGMIEIRKKEYSNRVELVCVADANQFDASPLFNVKFVNNERIVVCGRSGKIYYIKITNDVWEWGGLKTTFNSDCNQCLAVQDNIVCITGNNIVTVHDFKTI